MKNSSDELIAKGELSGMLISEKKLS
jgi:hypothetical protein